jgi:hypothetical protein
MRFVKTDDGKNVVDVRMYEDERLRVMGDRTREGCHRVLDVIDGLGPETSLEIIAESSPAEIKLNKEIEAALAKACKKSKAGK